jgi:NADH:ubiquinone oxidoreductase subunit E
MPSENDLVEIVVCYGTSCFARGNSENLDLINAYVQRAGANASVRLTGKLCQGQCMDGPNVSICGKLYHGVTAARLRELLQQIDRPTGVDHGVA